MATRLSSELSVAVMLSRSYSINSLTGTDGFRLLCHQFLPSSLPLPENCLTSSTTFSLKMKQLREALLLMIHHRRPGPRNPADGLPASEWPTVLHRVLEQKEPLRKVAEDDGVSHETRRRVVRAVRCASKASLRTDLPRSQHKLIRMPVPNRPAIPQRTFPIRRCIVNLLCLS